MTNMLSIRLQKIADMIAEGSNVIDIGCDHGFLDIYLTSVKNCTWFQALSGLRQSAM